MTWFRFNVRDGARGLADDLGVHLADAKEAKVYAIEVARELMKRDEVKKRPWLIEVWDEEDSVVAAVAFATVDPTLDHLSPDVRRFVECVSESLRTIKESMRDSSSIGSAAESMWARRVCRPHLVAVNGRRLDVPKN